MEFTQVLNGYEHVKYFDLFECEIQLSFPIIYEVGNIVNFVLLHSEG